MVEAALEELEEERRPTWVGSLEGAVRLSRSSSEASSSTRHCSMVGAAFLVLVPGSAVDASSSAAGSLSDAIDGSELSTG